jgi:hypothetical protein
MGERLLLDGIALNSRRIPPRDLEDAALIEPHLAHSGAAGPDETAVAACDAPHGIIFLSVDQLTRGGVGLEKIGE